jgi:hypothetical protein
MLKKTPTSGIICKQMELFGYYKQNHGKAYYSQRLRAAEVEKK